MKGDLHKIKRKRLEQKERECRKNMWRAMVVGTIKEGRQDSESKSVIMMPRGRIKWWIGRIKGLLNCLLLKRGIGGLVWR